MQQKNHRSISLLLFWKCFLLCLLLGYIKNDKKRKNVTKIKKRKKTLFYIYGASVAKRYTLVPVKERRRSAAGKVTAGLVEGTGCMDVVTSSSRVEPVPDRLRDSDSVGLESRGFLNASDDWPPKTPWLHGQLARLGPRSKQLVFWLMELLLLLLIPPGPS